MIKGKWVNVWVSKGQNWILSPKDVKIGLFILDCLESKGSMVVTKIYKAVRAEFGPRTDIYYIRYLLMFLWKRRKIRIRCNYGYRIVYFNKSDNKKVS